MTEPPTTRRNPRLLSRTGAVGPFLALAAFVLVLLHPLCVGRALYWGDIGLYFEPMLRLVGEGLRNGRTLLWNPGVLCGQPLVGNPQVWMYYPGMVGAALLPAWLYLSANSVAHVLLGAWGAYLFLRRLCRDRPGAVLGAIAFAGSGWLIARLQFPPMVQAAAYLPWLLLMVDRVTDRPGPGYAALLALAIGLETLAGHAQVAYLALLCTLVYTVARLWHARSHRLRTLRAAGWTAAAVAVGVLSASTYVLPAVQLLEVSTRENLTWFQANRFALAPAQLVGMVLPRYFGSPSAGDYWGEGNAWEPALYVGLVPLALAGYAVCRSGRRGSVRFFAIFGVVALWLALGRNGGLYYVAFHLVPGMRSFHDPARLALITTVCLSALAAVGMRALRDRGVAPAWRIGLVALAAADLCLHGWTLNPTTDPAIFDAPRPAAAAASEEGRLVVTDRQLTWTRHLSYADFGPSDPDVVAQVGRTLASNTALRYHVAEAGGYEPVPVEGPTRVDGLVRAALRYRDPALLAHLAAADAHGLLLPQGTRYAHAGLEALRLPAVRAFAVRQPGARAWGVRSARRVDGRRRSLAVVADPGFDPRAEAVVSGAPGLEASGPLPPVRVGHQGEAGGSPAYAVDAGPVPAVVVVSAAAYPGWRAVVDGRPTQALTVNHAFIGVRVPPGTHTVTLTYDPVAVRVGLYLSLAAVCAIACGLTVGRLLRRRGATARGIGRPRA